MTTPIPLPAPEHHRRCKSCEGTGRWTPPGQDFKCLGCNGKGFHDMNAEYLCDKPRKQSVLAIMDAVTETLRR